GALDAERLRLRVVERAAPRHHAHAERLAARDHLAADRTGADDPQRAAEDPLRLAVLTLVPHAVAEVDRVVDHAAVEGEEEREGELGDGDGVLARAVRDVDAE